MSCRRAMAWHVHANHARTPHTGHRAHMPIPPLKHAYVQPEILATCMHALAHVYTCTPPHTPYPPPHTHTHTARLAVALPTGTTPPCCSTQQCSSRSAPRCCVWSSAPSCATPSSCRSQANASHPSQSTTQNNIATLFQIVPNNVDLRCVFHPAPLK